MLIKVPAQSPDAVSGFFVVNATTPGGIDQAFATIVQHNAGANLYSAHQFFQVVRGQLVALAARHRLPARRFGIPGFWQVCRRCSNQLALG